MSSPIAQHVQSTATCLLARGRCTLMATSSPSHVVPRYTCPRLAEATHVDDRSRSSAFFVGSPPWNSKFAARGPSHLRSSQMVCNASSSLNGLFSFWSPLSASAASSPMTSPRCAMVCPIFTNTGPRFAKALRRACPLVRFSSGSLSSLFQSAATRANSYAMTANRRATSVARGRKNACSLALLNSPLMTSLYCRSFADSVGVHGVVQFSGARFSSSRVCTELGRSLSRRSRTSSSDSSSRLFCCAEGSVADDAADDDDGPFWFWLLLLDDVGDDDDEEEEYSFDDVN
mmetsp:Transcript_12139/g.32223  ORF Transcript_12139/g.32223 Transcript_12139/m.32223 type:complete len:288 (+) Transcript_12139:594-1457(+)